MTGRVRVSSYAVSVDDFGAGEPLWQGQDFSSSGHVLTESTIGERATHLRILRKVD